MVPQAFLSHAVPGRIRVKIPSMRGNVDYYSDAAERLVECAGVQSVVVNDRTGSVLVLCAGDATAAHIGEFARERGLFSLEDGLPPVPPVFDRALEEYSRLDDRIAGVTEGEFDVRSAALVMLLVLGFVQLYRGQVVAPAATLFWYVLELLRHR
jgi:hypothetical protein